MRIFSTLFAILCLGICSSLTTKAQNTKEYLLYAFMNSAASWSEGNNPKPYYGFYSMYTDNRDGFTAVSPTGSDYDWACTTDGGGGGVYDDGYFYCFTVNGYYTRYTITFSKIDTHTWTRTATSSVTGKPEDPKWVPVDLTANPIDGNIYAICRPKLANSDYGVLCTVDRQNGTLTKVAQTQYYMTIACDANGQLYGFTSNGDLYKVNLDGTNEKIGNTGLICFPREQSATIDFRTGKMYLSHYGYEVANGKPNYNATVQGLYVIDVNTAKAELLHRYGDYNDLSALSFMNCHPTAPDMVDDFTFTAVEKESLVGRLAFTAPGMTYEQKPLQGQIKVNIYLDNKSVGSFDATPGKSFTQDINVQTEGVHTAKIILSANGHDGVQQEQSYYFGVDAPDEVRNLTLTASDDALTATLKWDAPTGSINGGEYDPAKVRYTIVRNPGNVVVQRAATSTTFTEKITDEYCRVTYVVTPYIDGDTGKRGKSVSSNKAFLGEPWAMPYAEPFNTADSWETVTVIDANGDGGDWEWEDAVWKYDNVYYCAFFYHSNYDVPSDDWMITPKLALDPTKLYRITFQLYGYYEGRSHHVRVLTGSQATVEAMHQVVYDETAVSWMKNPLTITRYFAPKEGDMYIGFHDLTEESQHVSIDNILVEEVGKSTVPAAVENLKAEAIDARAGKVRLSFDAPSLDAGGKPLTSAFTINIYRGDDTAPIKTFTDVQPGKSLTYEDNKAAQAVNIYRVVAENADGVGLETSTQIDLRAGRPVSVKNVKATFIAPSQVMLTWEAPDVTVDENGNEIDLTSMRYLVYRPGAEDYDIIGRDLKECQFIDNNPMAVTGSTQSALTYYVAAINGDGESYATQSNVIYIGESYKLPFAETWHNGQPANNPWLTSNDGSAGWVVTSQGYAPMVAGQDGLGVLSLDLNQDMQSGLATYWSPRVDLSEVKDAKLTFWMYGENTYSDNDYIQIVLDIEGENQVSVGASFCPKRWAGWKQQTVDLSPYVGNDRVSVIFVGNINRHGTDEERRIHIDNMEITGTPAPNEVKLAEFTGPAELRETVPGTYKVKVVNVGTSDAEEMPVHIYADGELVTQATVPYLSSGDATEVSIEFTAPEGSDELIELTAEIVPKSDSTTKNNSKSMAVEVMPLNLPYITDLNGSYTQEDGALHLTWSAPSVADYYETVVDGAEAYDAFAISDVGCWTMYDGDATLPFKFQDPTTGQLLSWENNDQLQAWMVFRPSDVTSDRSFDPYAGKQTFASWAAAGRANDDWLISPALSGDVQLISFYVRRLNERDDAEYYNVLYSTTDTDPASFRRINGDTPLVAAAEWELKHIALPEGTKYFAIQYVGYHQSCLLVDDLQFEAYPTHVRPDGYNVYRDGVKINTTIIGRHAYVDYDIPAQGVSRYVVRPVYGGIEAPESNLLIVDPAGVDAVNGAHQASVMSGKGFMRVFNACGDDVAVYSIDGKLQLKKIVTAEDEIINIQSGIYVVKLGSRSYKVIVR